MALLTRDLKQAMKEAIKERSRVIRLAEATFGPRDPRIKEFRPVAEGKVRTTSPRKAKVVTPSETT